MENDLPPGRHDPYAALRIPDFSIYVAARFCLTLGVQIQSVVVGIQVMDLTPGDDKNKALHMGYIGLCEAIPFILLSLFAGHVADVVRRKKIILYSTAFLFCCSWALFYVSSTPSLIAELGTIPIYGIIFCTGIARGFLGPVFPAFLAQLVPRKLYTNASTWNSNLWQTAAVIGPALGGLLMGIISIRFSYSISSSLMTLCFFLMLFVTDHPLPEREKKEPLSQSLTAGFRFVFGNQVMLSALSLDLFAVLFGGAVAMLPIFTKSIIHLGGINGKIAFGLLRAAPAVGSILMGIALAYYPPTRRAGRNLYVAVAGFGLCIIGFALSTNFYLSFFFLLASGCFDMVSVVIRSTIMQLITPNDMRGRVSAVNGIFIGSSNEIGELESGIAAKLLGVIPSVVFGGIMTIAVVGAVMVFAPKLRKLNLDKLV